jgi:hypothetical protein
MVRDCYHPNGELSNSGASQVDDSLCDGGEGTITTECPPDRPLGTPLGDGGMSCCTRPTYRRDPQGNCLEEYNCLNPADPEGSRSAVGRSVDDSMCEPGGIGECPVGTELRPDGSCVDPTTGEVVSCPAGYAFTGPGGTCEPAFEECPEGQYRNEQGQCVTGDTEGLPAPTPGPTAPGAPAPGAPPTLPTAPLPTTGALPGAPGLPMPISPGAPGPAALAPRRAPTQVPLAPRPGCPRMPIRPDGTYLPRTPAPIRMTEAAAATPPPPAPAPSNQGLVPTQPFPSSFGGDAFAAPIHVQQLQPNPMFEVGPCPEEPIPVADWTKGCALSEVLARHGLLRGQRTS